MYAAIDHHKAVFQAAMLDLETGVAADERFEGSRDPSLPAGLSAGREG